MRQLHKNLLVGWSLLFLTHWVSAQYAVVSMTQDTIEYENRVLTQKLDSISIAQSGYATLQPGGNYISLGGIYRNDYINGFTLFQKHAPSFSSLNDSYAGLPHLGFYYSFGSRGTQNIHVDYQQTLAKKFDIHISFNGFMLNEKAGFTRHSGYRNSVVQLLANYHGNRYQGLYFMNYYFGNRNSNRGVVADSLLDIYPLKLIPVKNETAFSKFNTVEAGTQHLFSLTKDSLIKHGFVYQNELKLTNRKYSESGLDVLNYTSIYKDSVQTYDQYQWYRIRNEGGYFLQTKRLKLAAKAFHQYWTYKNQGIFMDTSEVGVNADLLFNWSKFSLKSRFDFTFIGAIGEMESKTVLKWSERKYDIHAYLDFENKYPSVFLRKYAGNSVHWYLPTPQLQQTIKMGGDFSWKEKIPFEAAVNYAQLSNQYWLIDNELRNDTLKNVSVVNARINARFKAATFHFDPYLSVNITTKNIRFVPLLDARLNVYWNKTLFSTKKFDFILGATAIYQTKYTVASYNNLVDLYQYSTTSNYLYQPIVRLDIYTGFQIDNFRFFLRYENLDAFWNKKENFTVENYPIAPGLIRIGLTWDFFN